MMVSFSKIRLRFVLAAAFAAAAFFCACAKSVPTAAPTPYAPTEIFAIAKKATAVIECAGGSQTEAGTGFIFDRAGNNLYLMTNYHVVDGYDYPNITAGFFDGAELKPRLLGYDAYHDIAVLSVAAVGADAYGALEFAGEDVKTEYGEPLRMLGNSLGAGLAAFDGIVSRAGKILEFNPGGEQKKYVPVTQVTVPVNSGSSGAAVLDSYARVRGVGTYQTLYDPYDSSRPVQGTSHCVPGTVARQIARQIIAENPDGASSAAQIRKIDARITDVRGGAGILEAGPLFSAKWKNGTLTATGGNSAHTTGEKVKDGDVITKIGGHEFGADGASLDGIFCAALSHVSGDEMPVVLSSKMLTVTVLRDGVKKDITYVNYYEKNY
ncbi:MAG: S1C family serine protease [Clostridiales bacterium]|jgi:S1-C subfamily serine protease|nr:S1C family serine protease [Clostridiales bacterium]